MGVSKGYARNSSRLVLGVALLAAAFAATSQAEFRAAPLRLSASSKAPVARIAPVQNVAAPADYRAAPIGSSNATAKSLSAPIAGKRPNFYEANAASTVFQDKVQLNKKPEIQYFNAVSLTKEEEVEELVPQEEVAPEEAKKKDLETPEGILKTFGDPTEEDKVLALENAPAPFKGMMAALQLGEDELAFKYARRYARYMRTLKTRGETSVGLIGLAMQKEGMLPKNSWVDTPQYEAERKLAEKDKTPNELAEREETRVASLDSRTKEMLDRAQEAEEMEANPKQAPAAKAAAPAQLSEEAQRMEIRRSLNGKVPVDPKGEIDVFFFFRPFDQNSLEMVPEIEALYRAIATKGGVNFVASALENISPDQINAFRAQTHSTFPIKNAQRLVREFGVKSTPTVVIISRGTSRAVFEEGKRTFLYLDELSKIMRGQ